MKLEKGIYKKRKDQAVSLLRPEQEAEVVEFDPFLDVPEGTWEFIEKEARNFSLDSVLSTGPRLARLAIVNPRIARVFRESGHIDALARHTQDSLEAKTKGTKMNELRDAADFFIFGPEFKSSIQSLRPGQMQSAKESILQNLKQTSGFLEGLRYARAMLQVDPEHQAELRDQLRQIIPVEEILGSISLSQMRGIPKEGLQFASELRLLFPDLAQRIQTALQPFWSIVRERVSQATPHDIFSLEYDLLADAAICLAPVASIDEQGNLQLERRLSKLVDSPRLPERLQM